MLGAAAAQEVRTLTPAGVEMAAVEMAVLDIAAQQTEKTASPTQAAAAAAGGFIHLA